MSREPTISERVTAYAMGRTPEMVAAMNDLPPSDAEPSPPPRTKEQRRADVLWSLEAMYGPRVVALCAEHMSLDEMEAQAEYGHQRILRDIAIGESHGIGYGCAVTGRAKTLEEAREKMQGFRKMADERLRRRATESK